MISMDSGVETDNDSNDGSIVKYENLSLNQISNVSSIVTKTSGERESHYHRKMKSTYYAPFRSRHYVTGIGTHWSTYCFF